MGDVAAALTDCGGVAIADCNSPQQAERQVCFCRRGARPARDLKSQTARLDDEGHESPLDRGVTSVKLGAKQPLESVVDATQLR